MVGVVLGVLGVLIGAALFLVGVASQGAAGNTAYLAGAAFIVFSILLTARSRGGTSHH